MTDFLQKEIERAARESPQFGAASFPPVVPGSVLDLDGDYLAYYAAGGDDKSPGEARRDAIDRIELLKRRSGAERVLMHLSAQACNKAHRYVIATVKPYQGKRGGKHPKNWAFLREVFETYSGPAFTPKIWLDREADDGIAMCSTRGNRMIGMRDKDSQMLAGLHVDWLTFELIRVNPGDWEVVGQNGKVYGLKWFYLQLLQGDYVDNIPGVPLLHGKKCADKTAAKHLAATTGKVDAYALVQAAYKAHYGALWADALAEQAGLLWLRTDAKATIANVLEGFPPCEELAAAVGRLDKRVKETLEAYGCSTD